MKDKAKARKIVSTDGIDIYYWLSWNSNSRGNFRVLHPGSSMNHSSLESLENGLHMRGHSTIVLDPRGFGYSATPPISSFFSLEKYTEDLARILEKESIENPVLIGHSFGFMPMVDYVAKTNNASQIVGLCGSYNLSKTTQNKTLVKLFDRFRWVEYVGSWGTGLVHRLRGNQRPYTDQSNMEGRTDLALWLSIVDVSLYDVDIHVVSGRELMKWDIEQQISKITAPMLLLYGTNDLMVSHKAGKYIKKITPAPCIMTMIEGTHGFPLTNPHKTLEVIDRYAGLLLEIV